MPSPLKEEVSVGGEVADVQEIEAAVAEDVVNSNSFDDLAIGSFGNDRKGKLGEMSSKGRKKESTNGNHKAQWSQSTSHRSTWKEDFTGSEEFVGEFTWGVNPEYWAIGDGESMLGVGITRKAGSKGEKENDKDRCGKGSKEREMKGDQRVKLEDVP
ncbi:MAG: hypothetical protein Q9198_001449 [Flavoplaca austrocitrina]